MLNKINLTEYSELLKIKLMTQAKELQEEIDEQKKEIRDLEGNIQDLEARNDELEEEIQDLESDISKMESDVFETQNLREERIVENFYSLIKKARNGQVNYSTIEQAIQL